MSEADSQNQTRRVPVVVNLMCHDNHHHHPMTPTLQNSIGIALVILAVGIVCWLNDWL